jgi:hypothetical protein
LSIFHELPEAAHNKAMEIGQLRCPGLRVADLRVCLAETRYLASDPILKMGNHMPSDRDGMKVRGRALA